jgi:bifunctional enzyme CysN/CysC
VQDVYRFDERRIVAGRVESGTLRVGDHIVFSPNAKISTVASIERWNAPVKDSATAGESVGIILSEPIFVERGHIGSHDSSLPIETRRFRARIFWMGDKPFSIGKRYTVKLMTQEIECQLASIDRVIDATSLETSAGPRLSVAKNEVAEVTIYARSTLVMDNHERIESGGRFVIVDERDVAGGGIIFGGTYIERERIQSTNLFWSEGGIDYRLRSERNGHRGMVVWLTGLSGSGKSTLARALETNLFNRHMQVYVLDATTCVTD